MSKGRNSNTENGKEISIELRDKSDIEDADRKWYLVLPYPEQEKVASQIAELTRIMEQINTQIGV